jgi:uncharacterized GH25 family protein
MTLFRRSAILAGAAMLLAASSAQAARPWLLPSETTFNGTGDEWVTVDAAASTDLFYPDHPAQNWQPIAMAPDGTTFEVDNRAAGKLRSTFDVHMTKPGTYKIAVVSTQIMGSYMLGGERKPLPRGTTEATLATAVPSGATEVWTAPNNLRVETFATAGEPTTDVFKPTGKGLEMVPVTHPNDLAVGEPATFQFLLDGKPATNLPVVAIPGGVRYRSALKEIDASTDVQGKVTLTLPEPGMYWVSVTSGAPRGGEGGKPEGAPPAAGPGAGGPGAGGPGGEGFQRFLSTPPKRRDTYAMTVEVVG